MKKQFDIGINRMNLRNRYVSMNISSSKDNPYVNVVLEFPLYGDIVDEVKLRLQYISNVLELFDDEKNTVKLTLDISYIVSKNYNIDYDLLKKIFLSQEYKEIRINNEKCRKFKVIHDRNVTSVLEMKPIISDNTDLKFIFSVENIVIELGESALKNIKEEINGSILYYITEYTRLHYSIIKNVDKNYFETNSKFYKAIKSDFKL